MRDIVVWDVRIGELLFDLWDLWCHRRGDGGGDIACVVDGRHDDGGKEEEG